MVDSALVYKTQFKVRVNDVDMHQRCSPIGLLRLIHEAAMEQTLSKKVSAVELARENLGWVVISQRLEFFKDAHLGDSLTIITYPSKLQKIFTYRHYIVLNEREEVVAQSVGKFIMMNLVSRKMVAIPDHIRAMLHDLPEVFQLEDPQRIRSSDKTHFAESEFVVRYSDLDFNKHVGNRSYYKWIFDSFEFEFLKAHTLSEITFEFKSELHIGDHVQSNIYSQEDLSFYHELRCAGQFVAAARTIWKTIS